MRFLKKLFGGSGPVDPAPPPEYVPSPDAPAMIKLLSAEGIPIHVEREEYRKNVLPGHFEQYWTDPNGLATAIHMALNDEFVAEAVEPARQLCRIDPQPHRAAGYLAALLIKLKRFAEAEELLTAHIKRHGEDGVLLTNLAKVYAEQGDDALTERTIWRALELDPNQENGLFWHVAIEGERGGDAARQQALRRIAALPNSWRAQLWLARGALDANDVAGAIDWYRNALDRAKPVHTDLLMQMSGDLGGRGQFGPIVELCVPRFDPREHGMLVGNNLIKAYIDLSEYPKARAIIAQLRAQERIGWNENLAYWEGELERLDGKPGSA